MEGQDIKVKTVSVNDRELAVLTHHLLTRFEPRNCSQQTEVNELFSCLKLGRFEERANDLTKLSEELHQYDLTYDQLAFLFEALDRPMLTKSARIIGLGSEFGLRVFHTGAPHTSNTSLETTSAPATENQ